MKTQDTKVKNFKNINTELFKGIFVGMAFEANIATLQGVSPSKVYKAIDNLAITNTDFVMQALREEKEDGKKEGEAIGKLGKISHAQLRFLIDAYNAKFKEKIDTDKIMEWLTRGKEKGKEQEENKAEYMNEPCICPYCGETEFNKMEFKKHLQYECKEFINQPEEIVD